MGLFCLAEEAPHTISMNNIIIDVVLVHSQGYGTIGLKSGRWLVQVYILSHQGYKSISKILVLMTIESHLMYM